MSSNPIPEKSSAWTDDEREGNAHYVLPPTGEPPPPPWLPAFKRNSLVQFNGWWARVSGYGQNEHGEIGVFVVPTERTKGAMKR
jgi:hypothetical protein